MGGSAREFMNLRMMEEDYKNLPPKFRDKIEIKIIDVDGFDYSQDEQWQSLKKESTKAYKKLKNREFELRHNT